MPSISSPLAQTFTVPAAVTVEARGRFLTSVDVYFSAKDDNLPITLEIRNVVSGFPGNKMLPFSRVVKSAADVNVSDNEWVDFDSSLSYILTLTPSQQVCGENPNATDEPTNPFPTIPIVFIILYPLSI